MNTLHASQPRISLINIPSESYSQDRLVAGRYFRWFLQLLATPLYTQTMTGRVLFYSRLFCYLHIQPSQRGQKVYSIQEHRTLSFARDKTAGNHCIGLLHAWIMRIRRHLDQSTPIEIGECCNLIFGLQPAKPLYCCQLLREEVIPAKS